MAPATLMPPPSAKNGITAIVLLDDTVYLRMRGYIFKVCFNKREAMSLFNFAGELQTPGNKLLPLSYTFTTLPFSSSLLTSIFLATHRHAILPELSLVLHKLHRQAQIPKSFMNENTNQWIGIRKSSADVDLSFSEEASDVFSALVMKRTKVTIGNLEGFLT